MFSCLAVVWQRNIVKLQILIYEARSKDTRSPSRLRNDMPHRGDQYECGKLFWGYICIISTMYLDHVINMKINMLTQTNNHMNIKFVNCHVVTTG